MLIFQIRVLINHYQHNMENITKFPTLICISFPWLDLEDIELLVNLLYFLIFILIILDKVHQFIAKSKSQCKLFLYLPLVTNLWIMHHLLIVSHHQQIWRIVGGCGGWTWIILHPCNRTSSTLNDIWMEPDLILFSNNYNLALASLILQYMICIVCHYSYILYIDVSCESDIWGG